MKLFEVYPLYDVIPIKAEGVYIIDDKNKKYDLADLILECTLELFNIQRVKRHAVDNFIFQISNINIINNNIFIVRD